MPALTAPYVQSFLIPSSTYFQPTHPPFYQGLALRGQLIGDKLINMVFFPIKFYIFNKGPLETRAEDKGGNYRPQSSGGGIFDKERSIIPM